MDKPKPGLTLLKFRPQLRAAKPSGRVNDARSSRTEPLKAAEAAQRLQRHHRISKLHGRESTLATYQRLVARVVKYFPDENKIAMIPMNITSTIIYSM
eukprot:3787607-Amphidinium_carterae.1